VVITLGSSSPASSNQAPGASNVPVLQVKVQNTGGGPVNLTSITLTASGSGNSATGISNVSIYLDLNNSGVLNPGDPLLGSGVYAANGTLTITLNGAVVTNTANLLIVYNISSAAPAGATYQANVLANTDVTGTASSGNVQFQGAPVNGTTIRIVQLTSTPTNSPTITQTATITPSFTPTPILQTVVCPAWPNPSAGVPISFCVQVPGPSTVNVDVFTAAFRKIYQSPSYQVAGSTTLGWDLRDTWGNPAANGLYYVRVQVSGIQPTVKILKVLIIH
jgi:hypothetical protein